MDRRTGQTIEVVHHPVNRGKGAAIRSGLKLARGAITIIQDADLEYDPAEYPRLIGPILRGEADAVYGSRYLRPAGLAWGPNRVCVMLLEPHGSSPLRAIPDRRGDVLQGRPDRNTTADWACAASGSNSAPRSRPSSAGWACGSTRCPSPMLLAPSVRARRSAGGTESRPSPRCSDGGWCHSGLRAPGRNRRRRFNGRRDSWRRVDG